MAIIRALCVMIKTACLKPHVSFGKKKKERKKSETRPRFKRPRINYSYNLLRSFENESGVSYTGFNGRNGVTKWIITRGELISANP